MKNSALVPDNIRYVTSFKELVSTRFHGRVNAICWSRKIEGDFGEIAAKAEMDGNMMELDQEDLRSLQLTERGRMAREFIINDLNLLKAHGASPVLNVITHYERDKASHVFPTDVYSFHVDRSPMAVDTFLCTYYGAPSEILSNEQAEQKIWVPEIRSELRKLYNGPEEDFESFLTDHFFDLHYRAKPGAWPVSLSPGNVWRLATDHPGAPVLPCVHRAPEEKDGKKRLLLIC